MSNAFDQFDQTVSFNPFDRFDKPQGNAFDQFDISTASDQPGRLASVSGSLFEEQGSSLRDKFAGFLESVKASPNVALQSGLLNPIIEFTNAKARPQKQNITGISDTGYTDPKTGKYIDQGKPDVYIDLRHRAWANQSTKLPVSFGRYPRNIKRHIESKRRNRFKKTHNDLG